MATKRKVTKPKPSKKITIEPTKLQIRLFGVQRNDKNEIIAENVMAEGEIYPADFSNLHKFIKDAIKEHEDSLQELE